MRAIRAIVIKELSDILRNRTLMFSSLAPSVVFLIIPLMVGLRTSGGRGAQLSMRQMGEIMIRTAPELQGLTEAALAQIFVFRQFVVFLLMVPIITALAIAAHSIIGEKQTRSLEPLLATPITSAQLLFAKSLSAALPSVVLTWILFALYAVAIAFLALPEVWRNVLTPTTLILIGVICPLVAILGLSIGVIVSSRANDPRTAQQIGGLFVLPLMALFTAQLQGFYFLDLPTVLIAAVALAVIDVVVLGLGVSLFDRETVLVRWK
jgi:ABC-2 type transport system permease protein